MCMNLPCDLHSSNTRKHSCLGQNHTMGVVCYYFGNHLSEAKLETHKEVFDSILPRMCFPGKAGLVPALEQSVGAFVLCLVVNRSIVRNPHLV